MSRPRRLEPEELRELIEAGVPRAAIAKHYGMTVAGVRYYIQRYKLEPKYGHGYGRHKWALPWNVAHAHSQQNAPRNLRILSRTALGEDVGSDDRNAALRWARNLIKNRLDIDYSPEEPPNEQASRGGFFTKPADPKDWHLKKVLDRAELGIVRRRMR